MPAGRRAAGSQLPPDTRPAFGLLDLVAQITFHRCAAPAAAAQRQHGVLCAIFQKQGQPAVQGERHQRYPEPRLEIVLP
jgi:hypothetical protein